MIHLRKTYIINVGYRIIRARACRMMGKGRANNGKSVCYQLKFTSMAMAAMNVQDAVLPARAIKVPAKLVQKSLETGGYIHVARKSRKRPDLNSFKTM